jgi:hypothetical protein
MCARFGWACLYLQRIHAFELTVFDDKDTFYRYKKKKILNADDFLDTKADTHCACLSFSKQNLIAGLTKAICGMTYTLTYCRNYFLNILFSYQN